MIESRLVGTWDRGAGGKNGLQKGMRKLWGMMDMFTFLIVVMASQGKHQNIHFYTLNFREKVIMEESLEHSGSIFK